MLIPVCKYTAARDFELSLSEVLITLSFRLLFHPDPVLKFKLLLDGPLSVSLLTALLLQSSDHH